MYKRQSLVDQGFEVSVGGAPAYSTLGWFADPLLDSMMRYGDVNFAETLFHELAHQELYINGDSAFNEAFATVVGQQGVVRWLTSLEKSDELKKYQSQLKATKEFNRLLKRFKERLSVLYSSQVLDDVKRKQKALIFKELQHEYKQLKEGEWQGVGWFDQWFNRPLNNARLASFSTYYDRVPEFELLLKKCGGSLRQFYRVLRGLKKQEQVVRVPNGCEDR